MCKVLSACVEERLIPHRKWTPYPNRSTNAGGRRPGNSFLFHWLHGSQQQLSMQRAVIFARISHIAPTFEILVDKWFKHATKGSEFASKT
jgi:hypothetical protein